MFTSSEPPNYTSVIPSFPFETEPLPFERSKREYCYKLLSDEAMSHAAVNHVWLNTVAAHGYQEMFAALAGFAREYNGYSAAFPDYLCAVIERLDCEKHKTLLRHNLKEEKGYIEIGDRTLLEAAGIDVNSVDGVTHPQLFRRFCEAMGVTNAQLERPTVAAMEWRRSFLIFLATATPAAAVGALGLGTENIVKPIYEKILSGLAGLNGLKRQDYVFFALHCTIDDQHALDLKDVALSLLTDEIRYQEMRHGMLVALGLRNQFFNQIHQRESALEKAVSV